jgi:lipopolysaccharide transport system ATP-binding protein
MATVIKAENLSKLYYLGGAKHDSVRDALMSFIKSPTLSKEKSELWALRDVSFSLEEGETLGIVGNNGAGKSTLLKILSRITKPTGGTAELHGRVGSLLEVGTGFHNELTGRENIFLNGAILGMSRSEIEKQFDEIVAFSEIEKFLDTPVKHYSSGMYMRLAFSVAAHLDPEILIVDEVLAVGDTAFQKKCLNKMKDISKTGRTIIFVSHDLQAVSRLCSRLLWLKNGAVVRDGEANEIIGAYLHEQSQTVAEKTWENSATAPGNETTKLRRVRACDEAGETVSAIDIRRRVMVEMTYEVLEADKIFVPNCHFYNEQGVCIFVSHDWGDEWRYRPRPVGRYVSTVSVPANFLSEGTVFVTAAATTYEPFNVHFVEREVIAFNVVDTIEGDSARGDFAGVMPGVVRPILKWETVIQ